MLTHRSPSHSAAASPERMVALVASREASLRRASEHDLGLRVAKLRERAQRQELDESEIIEGFALFREAALRASDLRPFDVQILAGIALHRGEVVEMQTGEGKTLAAVAPAFLASLAGQGVHILTFNDYLAKRDAAWMGPIFELLGCSVGSVREGMGITERRQAYRQDVTYVTAKEAGFDLLRDQLCLEPEDQVHRPLQFAIADEADSLLIDEARIPLVIAGDLEGRHHGLSELAELARTLDPDLDYEVDDQARNVFLTDRGSQRVEEVLGCGHLFDSENTHLLAEVRNALHAEIFLHRDVDYLVKEGKIELVDELTGRIADRRRWPDGLQPAVEAKENLQLEDDGKILGSISLQHFLGLYPKLSGMTGTARGAADELEELYGLPVTVIPTHRPCIRIDRPDMIFTTRETKLRALLSEIAAVHATGRPILVGTTSVRESEHLARRLSELELPCKVLNARNDEMEASVIAQAGELGALTISTNMAGRGTDIRLGGPRVRELGGLYVIGTHRHESRRIDDQLRGRAGRQGDPGSTVFMISLEDDLIQRFGLGSKLPKRVPWSSDGRIDHPLVRREIARSQRILEGESFDIRKRLWSYSTLVEEQRKTLVAWRQEVLEGRADLTLLRGKSARHWSALRAQYGDEQARAIERRLTLLVFDRCWGEHLEDLGRIRDELHFVVYDGKTPLVEFCRMASELYHDLLERIDEEIVRSFEELEIGAEGIDWQAQGLLGPSATWTYLVNDNLVGDNAFLTLAMRPSFMMGAIVLWPLLLLWAFYLHLSRWRERRSETT